MKRLKKILLWLFYAMCISTILGIVDCWVAGTAYRNTLFSLSMWKLRDGGTTGYIGFGYSLTYYRKIDGEHGPDISYWFAPFSVYHTSERTGVRWLFASGLKEPTYQDRTLSQWISIFFSGYSGYSSNVSVEESEAAKRAIMTMGTNTIPTLIAWLSEDHPGSNRRGNAQLVFEILGEKARPAARALIELTTNKDNQIRMRAFLCLLAIKPENSVLIPALAQLIHDPDKSIAHYAAEEFMDTDADAAKKAGVFDLFPEYIYGPDLFKMQNATTNNLPNK